MSSVNTPVPANTTTGTSDDTIEIPSSPVNIADDDAKLREMKRKQDEELEKKRLEAAEKKARETEEKRERERQQAEEVEHQRKAAEAEKVWAEAEPAKQRPAGSASGCVAGSARSGGKGKGKGKATEGAGETPEEPDVMMEDEEPVVMANKCQECETKKKDCRAVVRGSKPIACKACRKSKVKCSLLPELERKRDQARTVVSPRGGKKRKKNKIAAAIAEGENQWDLEGEHRDNRDMLGALSQSMMGLTEEVH
ncbi:hypothetical protein BV22DRAFT_1052109 [Leucogyrophana mollusca]|uniref:Uncharacterized protein n=1 Tax=Leucogyrophana mollusca TaxID=85980 RepID=A0ACB8AXB9_9AGAM|nr:hypothetical protein BV22DRAFT_1052109 [Leucogyrophana mollusca]